MLGRRQDIARLQSDFFRDQFRKLLRWLFIAVAIILLQILAIIYLILFQSPQKFYANTSDGKIMELTNYITGKR